VDSLGELLVIAVPHDPDHAEFVGDGEVSFVGEGACSHDAGAPAPGSAAVAVAGLALLAVRRRRAARS
jgi:MYXO-CTERM domain-containing protein